jgi:hypothetical protein
VRLIDRLNTRWLRMSTKVADGAIAHAQARGADRIFSGHTHEAMHLEQDGVHYYNAGGWIDSRLTYITIGEEGVRIHEYTEDADKDAEELSDDSGLAGFDEFDSADELHYSPEPAESGSRR